MAGAFRTCCVSCPNQIPDACGRSHAYFIGQFDGTRSRREQIHATHRSRRVSCLELNTMSIGWERVKRKTGARTLVGGHDHRLSGQR